jgi:two-component system chemotaxis family response regulator WspR
MMLKALLVDDDATPAHAAALREAGCVEVATWSYDAALARLEAERGAFNIVVLDHVGSTMQRVNRLARMVGDLPLIVLCDERHIDSVLLSGATECVTKPLRSRELLGRLRSALRLRAEARHRDQRERRKSDAITALQRDKEELERRGCVDPMTGVANRRHALGLLEAEWRRSLRDHAPFGIVMIDLDCYHAYNEQYGHLGGDECLRRVADGMAQCLRRPSDLIGRYGGEEFIALLPGTDAIGARIVAERLRLAVEALDIQHVASTCSHVVTISAGFASLRATSDLSVDALIAAADAGLLRAKAQGRNRIDGDAPIALPTRIPPQRWQRWAPVHADPWLADRIPNCLQDAHAGARTIVEALRAEDARAILRTATPLLATARELRLDVLEGLLAELERAASAAEVTAAREAADALIQYVTHVQVIYRRAASS